MHVPLLTAAYHWLCFLKGWPNMRGLRPLAACIIELAFLLMGDGFGVEVATSGQERQTGGKVLLNHQTPTVRNWIDY